MTTKDYTSRELYEILKETVIGQDDYLKKLSVTMWLHNKRIQAGTTNGFKKHNLLCVGPTGSGKTLAVSTLAKLYGFDFIVEDMSGYTGSGWKGKNAEDLIESLLDFCKHNRQRTERGIIVMDEVDKMLLHGRVGEESFSAENALLKIIEGTTVSCNGQKVDTSNILFIAAGAFEGIEDMIRDRMTTKTYGFCGNQDREPVSVPKDEWLQYLKRSDLREYGVGAQFLGRFSDLAVLRKLSPVELSKILLESKASVVKDLDALLVVASGVRITMDVAGADAIANKAIAEGTGARGLTQILMPMLNDVIFNLDSNQQINEVLVTSDQSGDPHIKLLEGKRIEKEPWEEKKKEYTMPKHSVKNVEHFAWIVLEPYLNMYPRSFSESVSMHSLLCSLIFFVLGECNKYEWTTESLKKLLNTVGDFENGQCLYKNLIDNDYKNGEFSKDASQKEYVRYFLKFEQSMFGYRAVPALQEALVEFEHHATLVPPEPEPEFAWLHEGVRKVV